MLDPKGDRILNNFHISVSVLSATGACRRWLPGDEKDSGTHHQFKSR